jgi:subtilisin family serine protease
MSNRAAVRRDRVVSAVIAAALLVLTLVVATPATADTSTTTTQRYTVVFDGRTTDVGPLADMLAQSLDLTVHGVLEHAMRGMVVDASPVAARLLQGMPIVSLVEADRTFSVTSVPTGVARIAADQVATSTGIAAGTPVDVDVAILDTGVADHSELNVVSRVNCQSTLLFFGGSGCSSGGNDDNGHGTHVAGTVAATLGGSVVGVAPGARIWSVKVLGGPLGTGSTSDIIKGIDWVAERADQIEVINMSLGGSGTSSAMNQAIAGATDAGVVVVVAAGNDSTDAANTTPANAPNAITVSAITDLDGAPGALASGSCSGGDDQFATYSNFGDVVDIAAPGSCIRSTSRNGGTTSLSGTSMAAPHVAGAVGLFIADRGVSQNGSRWTTVLDGLLGEWSVPQSSDCGFTNGRSAEPLLYLVPCGDAPAPDPEPDPEPEPEPDDPTTASVSEVTYRSGTTGFLLVSRWLEVTVAVVDDAGAAVPGASVSITLSHNGSVYGTATGTTGDNGTVTFRADGVPRGCWTTTVDSVTVDGLTWDQATPPNEHCT